MFKSLREFNLDKPVNRKKLKIRFTKERGQAYTEIQLYNTVVLKRQNVNNIVVLASGGFRTQSTKVTINTGLRLIYGANCPHVFQRKHIWYVALPGKDKPIAFIDGMVIGGGCGAPFQELE